ncbi:N-acetyl-gamma-glutamyl-phosphate reductase [bacterium]|nr:N-acetyl-gamma-glutamyl-phosphate reductase [Rubripirellula sp.]MDB4639396.1 N-acetyl-gamma-glutamyl-phosphate reductase [bacterium]MDB4654399.1 N-acetyl-gamma-glutamyl-phosphate reductase [Rubripirellula sp.]
MKNIRVGIIGATGYTALEVARLLQGHSNASVVTATSRAHTGEALSTVHPSLSGRCDVTIETFSAEQFAAKCDIAMCCLPHGASAETVQQLVQHGVRVIDFSADFRLSDVDIYQHWYEVQHPWPERVGSTAYGMPEFFADEIRTADIVANPGCYPTSAILPLAPLLEAGLIDADDIIIDSKSGVSGAGRSAKVATLYCETNEAISAYAVGCHRHQPEIDDIVQRVSGKSIQCLFTPHLTPMDRGILSTIYVRPTFDNLEEIMQCWQAKFKDSAFIHPVSHLPSTKHVAGTNHVQMTARAAGSRAILVCAIDNLAKGASGAAVQNMNVMFGLEQTTGLF